MIGKHDLDIEKQTTVCPFCGRTDKQVKAGKRDTVQRYKCGYCDRRYVPEPRQRGYSGEIRQQALDLHSSGVKVREIGRRLGINPRSVINWIRSEAEPPVPEVLERRQPAIEVAPSLEELEAAAHKSRRLGKRRATIVDVAELAGVSVSTISNFLNDKGRMGEETRLRIRSAMAKLHFTPNSLVKAIRQRRTHIIGVIAYGLFDLGSVETQYITATTLGGINLGADTRGYNVLLYTGWPHRLVSTAGLDFLDGHIDGLIWVGPKHNEPALLNVAEAGLPAMVLLSREVIKGVGFVVVDNTDGIRQVVSHLTGMGHRRIAYAGAIDGMDFLDRLEGYYQGLKIAGIPLDSDLVAADAAMSTNWYPSGHTPDYEAAINRWLSLSEPPTAIVLSTDGWAEWMTEQLMKRGIRVPEDIAVTGFDNAPPMKLPHLKLTSVAQDFREIGRLGAIGLADLIDGTPVEDCRLTLPAELLVRESTTGYRFASHIGAGNGSKPDPFTT